MPLTDIGAAPSGFLARRLSDGTKAPFLYDQFVEVCDGRITSVRTAVATDAHGADLQEFDLVTPGFIDLQINGAGDTQFNFDPTPRAISNIAAGAREGGTAFILPTFITAPGRAYTAAINATHDAIEQNMPGILGVHLEGPFLSPERAGIHDRAAIRSMNALDIETLTTAQAGVILLTVAPEQLPPGALTTLVQAGLRVFAGHSAATSEQIATAEAEGMVGATHLFNAMSQLTGRAPGVVGGVLSSHRLFAGMIADGHHVDWANIAITAKLMPDRLCLVTDAMLTLAGETTEFTLHGEQIQLRDGRLTNKEGRLAGAHISLIECVRNMEAYGGVPLPTAIQMVTSNPARALALGDQIGGLRKGYRAAFTCLGPDLEVTDVIVGGRHFGTTPSRDLSP